MKLDSNNMIQGVLPSKQKLLILCDSGATKTLISMSTIGNSRYLSSLPKLATKCADFEIANGEQLTTKYAIKFKIKMQQHEFEKCAIAVENLGILT